MKRAPAVLLAALLLAPARAVAWTYQGVCWDADWENRAQAWYGSAQAKKQLQRLAAMGVNAISITPFAYQPDVNKPAIEFRRGLDDGLEDDVAEAHRLGLKVVYKPHIWSNQFWDGSGHWHGTIEMKNDADWAAWFANYEAMIVRHAAIAQRLKAEVFVIGLEYVKTTKGRDAEWKRVIAAVRAVFKGKLTYASHTIDEARQIGFWDALDYVGLNAYASIASSKNPAIAELRGAWKKQAAALRALSLDHKGKPILITEIGYSSVDGAAEKPFTWWPKNSAVDLSEQAACYDAMLTELKGAPWLAGLFIWKFKIGVTPAEKSREASEAYFVFQDKPAEAVIRRHFLEAHP